MHVNELFSLRGRTALVIGGAGKIGLPIAEALAEAGARVYIGSTNLENCKKISQELNEKGLDTIGIQIDQSSEESVIRCREEIQAKGEFVSVLVNSGVARPMTKFRESPFEEWDKSMQVNARGLYIVCQQFLKEMVEKKQGSIINVASIYGVVAPDKQIYENVNFETEPDYPYTKGGMVMYSKYLASFYAEDNVRCNCIAPGGYFNHQPQAFLDKYLLKVPMRRMAYSDDIKGVALFLASEASQYVTGQVLNVDGGLTIV